MHSSLHEEVVEDYISYWGVLTVLRITLWGHSHAHVYSLFSLEFPQHIIGPTMPQTDIESVDIIDHEWHIAMT